MRVGKAPKELHKGNVWTPSQKLRISPVCGFSSFLKLRNYSKTRSKSETQLGAGRKCRPSGPTQDPRMDPRWFRAFAFCREAPPSANQRAPQGSGGGEGEAARGHRPGGMRDTAWTTQVSPTQHLEVGSAFCPVIWSSPRPLRESETESHAHLGKLRLEQRLDLTGTALPLAQPLLWDLISGSPGRLAGQEGDHGPGDR